ncbi:MAG TPA: DUF459 domain-containing protein [Acidimicrobiales bacterium]|nr:DUF459 domain-containing protein [Acidimicrobiales bacterium]
MPILATLLGAPGPVVPVPMSSKPAGVAEGLAAEGLGAVQGPVLEVGDSLGVDLGWGLATALEGTGHAFVGAAVGDTGLAEPEYYNWPAHLASDLSSYRPGLVVVFLGANDVENLYSGGRFDPFGTKPWAAAYGQRVSDVLQEVRRAGARTLWVGMPPMGNPSFSGAMGVLNAVYQARVALEQPGATYFSSWDVLGNQGVYEAGPPGFAGNGVVWRAPDGVHITQAGADVLAGALVHYLRVIGWFAPLQDAVSK